MKSALGAGQNVVIFNGANPPAATTVTIAPTAPGIFTADGSGVGEAAAINTGATSGLVTLNSTTNPAHIGDTVSLYLTGEGNYNPSPLAGTTNTGYIIPVGFTPLPQISPLPTVNIGGVDASAGSLLRWRGSRLHHRRSADQRCGPPGQRHRRDGPGDGHHRRSQRAAERHV